jgi:hypothetical protein
MTGRLRNPLAFSLALAVGVSLANCYAPELENCSVACGAQDACPEGQHCDHGLCTRSDSACEAYVASGGSSAGAAGETGAGGLAPSGGTGGESVSFGGAGGEVAGGAGSGGWATGEPSRYEDLYINEVYFYNPLEGQYIELYNGSTVTRHLQGFRVMCDDTDVTEPFGDVSIPPQGFLLLTGAVDFQFTLRPLETKKLTLLDDIGATADTLVYQSPTLGLAVCRKPDGGAYLGECDYSKGTSNSVY